MMKIVCAKVHIEDDLQVKDAKGEIKNVAASPDIKGILGSNAEKYIVDLFRLSPRDLNYLGAENESCVLRPELV